MPDLTLSEIMAMQKELQDKNKGRWSPLTPEYGRSCLLWMVEEIGEVVAVVKKCGEPRIMSEEAVRAAFTEEFADVLMFMGDALMCYGITSDELSEAYRQKHARNMNRDWEKSVEDYTAKLREK